MDLKELKSKAFDIRAAIDFKQSEIAKLTEEYNKIAPEIFKLEQEANKPKTEPDIKPADEK
jgi:uncharacterized coiled-coil DUF342 family protein